MDTTKSDKTSSGITDITNIPDVALWSKEMTTGNITNVEAPIIQGIVSIEKPSFATDNLNITKITRTRGREKGESENKTIIVDPANPEEVSTVINSGSSITDKAKAFPTISNKLASGTSKTSRRAGKDKIIKFHGTEVDNVIIEYARRSKVNPENMAIIEFDSSKLKGKFETVNIQVIADYITITFY